MDTNTKTSHLLAPDATQPSSTPSTKVSTVHHDPTPDLTPTPRLGGAVLSVIAGSAVLRLALAGFVANFVLVDDAYIHLRYASNLWNTGDFVYNAGEPVFGLTSPLFGLICTALYGMFGSQVAAAITTLNVALWTAVSIFAARALPQSSRFPLVALICLAPIFVDNQMLGMESALFTLLLMGSLGSALSGNTSKAATWYGITLITRPEAVLLAPVLLWAASRQEGWNAAVRKLVQPRTLLLLLGPGILWCTHAMNAYGSIIPQSMVAKTGWNNDHYDGLFGLSNALLAVPRLTLIPFVDYFPGAIAWSMTTGLIASVGYVIWANVSRGDATSRAWLGFYLIYVASYVAGKGATEASWYAVPSSLAFLMAARPALPEWTRRQPVAWTLVLGLAVVSFIAAQERASLLQSYVDGYGEAALWLEDTPHTDKVVIGEIGVFGFLSSHPVVDVGALVSPEVLPWKNNGLSFCSIVQESGARWFVISDIAVEKNFYPSVGDVWANETERAWFETCTQVAQHADKRTYATPSGPDN